MIFFKPEDEQPNTYTKMLCVRQATTYDLQLCALAASTSATVLASTVALAAATSASLQLGRLFPLHRPRGHGARLSR